MKATSTNYKIFTRKKLTTLGLGLLIAGLTAIWLVSSASAAIEVPNCSREYSGAVTQCTTSASEATPVGNINIGKGWVYCGTSTLPTVVFYKGANGQCGTGTYPVSANISTPAGSVSSSQDVAACGAGVSEGTNGADAGAGCVEMQYTTASTPVASVSSQYSYYPPVGMADCGAGGGYNKFNGPEAGAGCGAAQNNTTVSTPARSTNVNDGAGAGTSENCSSWNQVNTKYVCLGYTNP